MISIRRAKHEDIQQLEILFQFTRQETFASRPNNEFQIGDYQKSTADDEVWVMEENTAIIGFVSVYSADNFIHNLFIHPSHQRCGKGTQLLQIAEKNLERPMTLKVAMDNLRVCSFYEKHGWYQASIHQDTAEPYMLYKKD